MHLTIYSQPNCTYCDQAKALMKSKSIEYTEVNLNVGQVQVPGDYYVPVKEFRDRFPNTKALPLILDGRTVIGGFNELKKFLRYD